MEGGRRLQWVSPWLAPSISLSFVCKRKHSLYRLEYTFLSVNDPRPWQCRLQYIFYITVDFTCKESVARPAVFDIASFCLCLLTLKTWNSPFKACFSFFHFFCSGFYLHFLWRPLVLLTSMNTLWTFSLTQAIQAAQPHNMVLHYADKRAERKSHPFPHACLLATDSVCLRAFQVAVAQMLSV